MVVPPGNHRGSDLRRTVQYVARRAYPEPVEGPPEDARETDGACAARFFLSALDSPQAHI